MDGRAWLTVIVFMLLYLWLIFSRHHRAKAAWACVCTLFLLPVLMGQPPILSPRDLFALDEGGCWASINWNVMGVFAGTMVVADAFIYSRVPTLCADLLIDRSPTVGWAILSVCALAGGISAFVDNAATVLIVAPIAIALARRLRVSPAPFVIGIAICANLEGAATLIGDPPSMILASHFRLNFSDFFWLHRRPSMFFAIQIGALASLGVLWLMFRRYRQPIVPVEPEKVRSWFPPIVLAIMIAGLACASRVDPHFRWFGAFDCLTAGAVTLAWFLLADRQHGVRILKAFDLSTLLFLAGIFMMVHALSKTGVVEAAASRLGAVMGDNVLGAFLLVVVCSMVLSAFIDNIPYVAAMLPVVSNLRTTMGMSAANMLLPFGLLVGACLGGNITPIGASANVVAYGLLHKVEPGCVSFLGFMKIGLPFTLAAVAAGALFLWATWMWF